jgi:hypothetical protein
MMPTPRLPLAAKASKQRRPRRLWPLFFLPFAGMIVGVLRAWVINAGQPTETADVAFLGASGLAAGSFLMALVALGVLAARLGRRQYTIRALLVIVALSALAFGLVRACLP